MYAKKQTYIHTYRQASYRKYIQADRLSYTGIHTSIHTDIQADIHTYNHANETNNQRYKSQ